MRLWSRRGTRPAAGRLKTPRCIRAGRRDASECLQFAVEPNFRFTGLEILAVKAGVGMKCRDLLTDEDLFLMEKSFSQGDVKGVILFVSIAPMEDVYVSVGNILPLPRENARAIFGQALEKTGISSECPIRLSFDQQRKLAAETIKAYVALRTR